MTALSTRPARYIVSAVCVALAIALTIPAALAGAAWTSGGVRLNTTHTGYSPKCIPDGDGGGIFVYQTVGEIYAQHVSASGAKDWGAEGVAIRSSAVAGGSDEAAVVSDGQGGAYIAWRDSRNPSSDKDIYAQRINASGNVLFTANGVYVGPCGNTSAGSGLQMTFDGINGAWMAWVWYDGVSSDAAIASHIEHDASVLPAFAIGASANIDTLDIDNTGSLSAVVAWYDQTRSDVYANRVTQAGHGSWNGSSGIPVCNATNDQYMPQVVADGSGGAIVLWEDYRSSPGADVYANHLTTSGSRLWNGTTGKRITSSRNTLYLSANSDGEGGAVASYIVPTSPTRGTVGANRVTVAGQLPWNGTAGVTAVAGPARADAQTLSSCWTLDGTALTWQDMRSGSAVYTQKLDASGCGQWGTNGRLVANVSLWASIFTAEDGHGGSLVAWDRDAGAGNFYPYGQRMTDSKDTWYLAEGSTAWGFYDSMSIENPNSSAVTARVTYMPTGSAPVTEDISIPRQSQYTITNDHLVSVMGGKRDFSTKVKCLQGKDIAVDRTMSWGAEYQGERHSSVGVTYPATAWYLPEGSTNWGFECWLLIQNPNASAATCQVTYMIEGEAPQTREKTVPANSRATYDVSDDIGEKDASIRVVSDRPVIPERAMYRNSRQEGHESIGTTSPALDYYLAEGSTAWGFTNYVLVQNPNSSAVNVTITYMTSEGDLPQPAFSMPANSRKTVRVNDVLPNRDVSTKVHGSAPIIAERAMYWSASSGKPACHDSIGMARPHASFYLPDGQSNNGAETWTLVQNPNSSAVKVKVSYLTPTGTGNVAFIQNIPAGSRMTFNMADKISGRASIRVESMVEHRPIMVERAMYWGSRQAGSDTIGGYSD